MASIYGDFSSLIDVDAIPLPEKELFTSVCKSMTEDTAQNSLLYLCKFLTCQNKVQPIILLDEYDTPLQAAWLNGYWDELVDFMRGFFTATFKSNPWMRRGLITGITRVRKESLFSDMNNLEVVSTISDFYSDGFGFTEDEVFSAMDEYGLTEKEKVKNWYDGYIFGKSQKIYNPWSISNYLKMKEFVAYWARSSSNKMVGKLIVQADNTVKEETSSLLRGESIIITMDEEIEYSQLDQPGAIWSFLMSAGYVKPISFDLEAEKYELTLTNHEVHLSMRKLISSWFNKTIAYNRKFLQALLNDDLHSMNKNLRYISETIFSFFDTGGGELECFYHGFVLGLIVDLIGRYDITSNRESGDGRYDIIMFPRQANGHGIVIEFKTMDTDNENTLEKTCKNALKQIKNNNYITELLDRNVRSDSIFVYGFAFNGKHLLICGGAYASLDWKSVLELP